MSNTNQGKMIRSSGTKSKQFNCRLPVDDIKLLKKIAATKGISESILISNLLLTLKTTLHGTKPRATKQDSKTVAKT